LIPGLRPEQFNVSLLGLEPGACENQHSSAQYRCEKDFSHCGTER
jgi:hypothetical protein